MMYRLKQKIWIGVLLSCLSACDQPIGSERTNSSPGDLVEDAASVATNVQDVVRDVFGGSDAEVPTESGGVPRYHWKSSRRGRQQARMFVSSFTSESQMQNNAIQLAEALGGSRWIVAFYSDIQSVEEWPNGPAVDSKRADYAGAFRLDAGRPPKIRFSPPGSTESGSDSVASDISPVDEEQATTLLNSAKRLLKDEKKRAAELQLQTVVKKYALTSASREALLLLSELPQKDDR